MSVKTVLSPFVPGGSDPDSPKSPTSGSLPAAALPGGFQPTQWSVVMAAANPEADGRAALEKLCTSYWPPSFWFFRRQGYSQEAAEDMTQEFFYKLLSSGGIRGVDQAKGRFRSWLLGALKNSLLKDLRKNRTQKRGGKHAHFSLDAMPPGMLTDADLQDDDSPEKAFDRKWAAALVAKASTRLEREYELADQTGRYAALQPFLVSGTLGKTYAEAAQELGLSEEATKSAIYKLRQRFAKLLRHEVTQTVQDPSEAEDELRFLLQALRN